MATKKTTTSAKKKAAPRGTAQKHYRNLRHTPVGIRLRESDRKIELAPRGQRGDIAPIRKTEKDDPDFIVNKDLLFEVISDEEAKLITEKQAINQQTQQVHPALSTIRNELGEEYGEDALKITVEEDKSKTVAYTEEAAEGVGNIVVDRGVGIRRAPVPGSTDYELPHIPDSVDPEAQADYRAKHAQELKDLGLKVVRDEPQKG